MNESSVPYDLKSACGWIYTGNNTMILACWEGCIDGPTDAGSCNAKIGIPIDYDYCMLNRTVKGMNEA